ncbi:hypothetical protein BX667DRAFT_100841 [Coemansia mojavensis]|nr:hypothetical protein BX667DRAFT_100841 [Coemansia mojavensis]
MKLVPFSILVAIAALVGSVLGVICDRDSPTAQQCALLKWDQIKSEVDKRLAAQWDQLSSSTKEKLIDSGALNADNTLTETPTAEQLVALNKYLPTTFGFFAFFISRKCISNPPNFIPECSSASSIAFSGTAWYLAAFSFLASLY